MKYHHLKGGGASHSQKEGDLVMNWLCLGIMFSVMFVGYGPGYGQTLKMSFSFKKKPPSVALVYFGGHSDEAHVAHVDQKDQQFSSKLYVGSKGSSIKLKNSDGIDHNIYANDKDTGVKFDIGLAKPGAELSQELSWDEGKVVKIRCMIHPKMMAYVASIRSKHYKIIEFSKKEKKKALTLDGLPYKNQDVNIWMPKYDPIILKSTMLGQPIPLIRKGKEKGTVTLSL